MLLRRTEALRLYTAGGAWLTAEEDRKGTLAPGRFADLVVLSADYFTVPDESQHARSRSPRAYTPAPSSPCFTSATFSDRTVLSVKAQCLDRLIMFVQGHLERVLSSYVDHYHAERPHQGLGNELIDGKPSVGGGDVVVHERLGGLLNSYHRAAA